MNSKTLSGLMLAVVTVIIIVTILLPALQPIIMAWKTMIFTLGGVSQ